MDKYEYKVRAEQIKALIREGEYAQAAEIADTIDWRRIKNVAMLCTISDLYKINRRYEDARDMLLLAYDRHPGGRSICYSLCELSIKLEEFPQAVEYYKEFVQVAPRDNGRYILQYKLYEAQNVNLEERIAVLEEYKKRGEYREKWLYELAFLYHRVGLGTRCVEICDELILLFGNGKYVIKAMELKMLHEPLTPAQQVKYDNRFHSGEEEAYLPQEDGAETVSEDGAEESGDEDSGNEEAVAQDAQEETVIEEATAYENGYSEGELNEGEEVSESSYDEDIYEEAKSEESGVESSEQEKAEGSIEQDTEENTEEKGEGVPSEEGSLNSAAPTQIYGARHVQEVEAALAEAEARLKESEEIDIQVKTVDVSEYNTINLQRELAEGLKEVLGEEQNEIKESGSESEDFVEDDEEGQSDEGEYWSEEAEDAEGQQPDEEEYWAEETEDAEGQQPDEEEYWAGETEEAEGQPDEEEYCVEETEDAEGQQPDELPEEFAEVLSMSSDGQIHLVVPEEEQAEEQIEGQITLEDVLNGADEEELPQEDEFEELEEILEEEPLDESEEILKEEPLDESEEILEEEPLDESEEILEEEPLDESEEILKEEPEKNPGNEIGSENKEGEKGEKHGPVEREKARVRELTHEERELFGQFLQNRSDREHLIKALDSISMAAYTGNVIVTGDEGLDTFSFAKNIVLYVQLSDTNFSGKTAKISGAALNEDSVEEILGRLENGALIIQKASAMNEKTCNDLYKILQRESLGIIVVLEDTKRAMNRFLAKNKALAECFNARVDMEALSDETLVAFGKKYAKELEYSIDEMGVLALHTRIHDMQSSDHAVTVMEVKEIVDEAIKHANRKNLKHFCDVLFAKRYDEEDMIILREKDFLV